MKSVIIDNSELETFSNDELLKRTKERSITFYFYNGAIIQLCVNDFLGFDVTKSLFYTKTAITIALNEVDHMKKH